MWAVQLALGDARLPSELSGELLRGRRVCRHTLGSGLISLLRLCAQTRNDAGMKLYVCYGDFGGDWHHCSRAARALREAGHEPEIVRTYGWGALPDALNFRRGRVRELTGENWVPAVEFADGTALAGTEEIVAWAKEHPVVDRA